MVTLKSPINQQQTSTIFTMKNFLSILSFAFLLLQNAHSQEGIIHLKNPSFEGVPQEGTVKGPMPDGWFDCGFGGQSKPDVHPQKNSTFGVTMKAVDGNTYLGMVVRDNDTWESVGQELSAPLQAGIRYKFSIQLARSQKYESASKKTRQLVNFTTPCVLRIWGGNASCEKREKLAESNAVINSRWLRTDFVLQPSENFTHLILEAFYKKPVSFPYNGNLLLDNASDIIPMSE